MCQKSVQYQGWCPWDRWATMLTFFLKPHQITQKKTELLLDMWGFLLIEIQIWGYLYKSNLGVSSSLSVYVWCRVTELDIAQPFPEEDGKILLVTLWPFHPFHPIVTCSLHTINILHLTLFPVMLNTDQSSHIFSQCVQAWTHWDIFWGREKRMLRPSGSRRTAAPDWWGAIWGASAQQCRSHGLAHSSSIWHVSSKEQGSTMLWIRELTL